MSSGEATQYDVLELMLEDMAAASPLYQPSTFWQKAVDELIEDIRIKGIDGFRSLPSALRFFVPNYGYNDYHKNPDAYWAGAYDGWRRFNPDSQIYDLRLRQLFSGELHALADYRVYLASMSDAAPYTDRSTESTIGNPLEQFEFDGRRFSRAFLNYLLGLNYLKNTCAPKGIHNILEIGGGYGSLGEILLDDPRNGSFYIDVDIPPTGFAATYYLQSRFGRKAVGDYEMLRNQSSLSIDDLRQRFSAVVLCPWQLPKITGVIDLFVNYISFQEMEPDIVENYLRHVQRLAPRYILLRNLREGKQAVNVASALGVRKPILGPDYDQFLPGYTLVSSNTLPFGRETEDGFHSELRLYCCRNSQTSS